MEIVGLGQFVSDLLAMYLRALEEELLADCSVLWVTFLLSGNPTASMIPAVQCISCAVLFIQQKMSLCSTSSSSCFLHMLQIHSWFEPSAVTEAAFI